MNPATDILQPLMPAASRNTRDRLLATGRYIIAAVSVVAAAGISLLLQEWGVHVFLFAFYAAVVGAAWIGTGPGVLSVVLSVVAA